MSKPVCLGLAVALTCVGPTVDALAREGDVAVAHPDWSPDGRQLAFEANRNGARNIYIMNADGTQVRQLTSGDTTSSYPRFSPDGKRLVYLSMRDPLPSMHLIHVDGTGKKELLPAEGNLEPAFSPDGGWITFRSYCNGTDRDGEIMMVDAAGLNTRRLTDNFVEDGYPVFSSDGSKLYFHREIDGYRQIITLDLATGTEVQLTYGDFNSWHAHPSPDGGRIVYDADPDGNRDIYLLDLESHEVKRLTAAPGRDGYPKFSPDGRRIAFHSERRGATSVYVMNADGSDQSPVTPHWPELVRLQVQ